MSHHERGELVTYAVFKKLRRGASLTAIDEAMVAAALAPTRLSRSQLFLGGDAPDGLLILLSGLACRYKKLRSGARQIVAVLVPGDACDVHGPLLKAMDYGMAALGPCTFAHVPRSVVTAWKRDSVALRQALAWSALTEEAIMREWLVNLGTRNAVQRMAHLFCELHLRMQAVSEAGENRFALPMTQEDLGQTLGLSLVHVHRTIGSLRADGLAIFARGAVEIADVAALRKLASFQPDYLNLDTLLARISEVQGEPA